MQTIVVAIDRAARAEVRRTERAFMRSGRSRHALSRAAMPGGLVGVDARAAVLVVPRPEARAG